MFESLFKDLPVGLRRALEKRLESLVLDISEEKVPDLKAVINLTRSLRNDILKAKKQK